MSRVDPHLPDPHLPHLCSGAGWLIAILALAGLLRLVWLDGAPPGFNQDEASNGYDAYCFLKTGRDRHGDWLPVTLKAFSDKVDHRSPVYAYLSVPSVWAFGLTHFGTRFPAALLGTVTVGLTFLLGRTLLGARGGLAAAALLAVSPWHIFMSRFAHEPSVVPFFLVAALCCLLRGTASRGYLLAGAALAALLLYNYPVTRLFGPVLLLAYAVVFRREVKERKRAFGVALALFVLLVLPLAYKTATLYASVQGRFHQISIFDEPFPKCVVLFALNYLSHFAPSFLFGRGGVVEGDFVKIAYLPMLPVMLVGLWECVRQRQPSHQLLLAWLLAFPLAASLTYPYVAAPSALRPIVAIPLFELLAALGFERCLGEAPAAAWRKLVAGLLALALAASAFFFVAHYLFVYPRHPAPGFQYGFRQALQYVAAVQGNYDKVFITDKANQPHIFVLFYGQYDPRTYQTERVEREYLPSGWWKVNRFGKYRFGDIRGVYEPNRRHLYVARPEELAGREIMPLKTVGGPGGKIAFLVVRGE
ncbi:MAG: phospholipid carrier-dependent glycosyltransferase [Planctomycetes bacterium]|nr:phospholipid carrier-dependent glycosyltransferase [Planctomycetota bacterium]